MASLTDVLTRIVNLIPWPGELPADQREKLLADIAELATDITEDVVSK